MHTRSHFSTLAAIVGLTLTAGCVDPAAQSSSRSDHGASQPTATREQPSARHSGRTTDPPTPEPTTSSAPASSAPTSSPTTSSPPTSSQPASGRKSALLYYADGKIHDGRTTVRYVKQPTSRVTYVSQTVAGWVLREDWAHVGGQVVLVRRDGTVVDTYGFDDVGYRRFDVSDDGTQIALVTAADRTVRIVDAETGRRIRSVETSLWTYTVRYSGDDLVISGGPGRTLAWDADTGDLTELPYLQSGRIAQVIDVSADGQAALVDTTVRLGARPCLSLYPVDPEATPRWQACDVSAYEGALSPDGSLLITYRADTGSLPTSFQVTDVDSGAQVDSIDPSGVLIDAVWTAGGRILVKTATDRSVTSFTLLECSIGGRCATVATPREASGLGRIG